MNRITRFIIYVSKDIMKDPNDLADAVMTHFIKKNVDSAVRKKFLSQFIQAPMEEAQLQVIDAWIDVRDVVKFPFKKKGVVNENKGIEGGVPVDDGTEQQEGTRATPDGSNALDGDGDD